ncbi:MAG: ferritin-like fold-containing protein [Candidatus Nanopelagicales bacterium]|nr:ferritin-like fold-containing protein [Candidatus Nanopelagicales bacterium]MDZ4248849.1 ferritin-like fold-containing protein [Candidatus Nanopelagicales bacterium]MDZ7578382.1 ferritin-like fold-containing protein [Candidatus Nanopelagicales bacterium]
MPYEEAAEPLEASPIACELLGLVGCGELFAFETLAADATRTSILEIKAALGSRACREFRNFEKVADRLRAMGADPDAAIGAYVPTMTEFHRHTAPRDLYEGLVKAYVGDGITSDFGRELSNYADPGTREFVAELLEETGQAEFVVPFVRKALSKNPGLEGRLALWGRRLIGEALAQTQRLTADREELSVLLVGTPDQPGRGDLAEFARMLARMTDAHTARMKKLGLAS